MKLTREQAIEDCKKLWDDIEKSGLSKADFLFTTEEGEEWLERYPGNCCPLCTLILLMYRQSTCS